jgi:hypothetical protein
MIFKADACLVSRDDDGPFGDRRVLLLPLHETTPPKRRPAERYNRNIGQRRNRRGKGAEAVGRQFRRTRTYNGPPACPFAMLCCVGAAAPPTPPNGADFDEPRDPTRGFSFEGGPQSLRRSRRIREINRCVRSSSESHWRRQQPAAPPISERYSNSLLPVCYPTRQHGPGQVGIERETRAKLFRQNNTRADRTG